MHWFIQDTVEFASLSRNVLPLVSAMDELSIPYRFIGVVPFTWEITGLPDDLIVGPVHFYGGTKLIEKIYEEKQWVPGVYFHPDWFLQDNWIKKRTDMLNQSYRTITVKELKENWVQEVSFIRPKLVKIITGQVIEPEEQADWIEENKDIPDETYIHISPYHKIEKEWRFFIINNRVVTGSLYKRFGHLSIKEPISQEVWEQANTMAEDWLPSPNIVMDICQLRNGEYKVVEFNCVNCSGIYNAEWKKVLEAII